MQGAYVIAGILFGVAGAGSGWLLGAPAWVAAGLYVMAGSLGITLAAVASLLAPLRGRGRAAGARDAAPGSWRARGGAEARASGG